MTIADADCQCTTQTVLLKNIFNIRECQCPLSYLSRGGLKFAPVAGQKSCSLCGSPESTWPSSFQKDPRDVAQHIQSHPYWSRVLGGGNDTDMEHSNPVCHHQCKRNRVVCGSMQRCCSCSGSSGPCSVCGARMLVATTQQYSGGGPVAVAQHGGVGPVGGVSVNPVAVVQQALQYLTGTDGSRVGLTRSQLQNRESRLNSNVNNRLLHQTGVAGARGIITSGQMNKGQKGIAAGGIYFAVTADETMHKAHYHGFLFTLRVRLGNVEHWRPDQQDPNVTFESLQLRGVDSVHIPRHGGDEYIVYHSDQVQLLNVQMVQLPANYPHGTASAGLFKYPTQCVLVGPELSTSELRKNSAALDAFISFNPSGAQQILRGGGGRTHAASGVGADHRPVCQYAPNCYRQNVDHWQRHAHPGQHAPVPKR